MNDQATSNSQPFDDMRALIQSMPEADSRASAEAASHFENFTGPKPALGSWQTSMSWLAGWQGTPKPVIERPLIAVFAGTHDVVSNYSSRPIVETAQTRVARLTSGKVPLRGMAARMNAAFKVYEMGLEYPVADMTKGPTLTEKECAAAMAFGMEVVAEGADIIVLGCGGYGTATAAAAIARGLYGGASEYWAGAHNATAAGRIDAVERATSLHGKFLADPLHCLRCFGGRDIAGLVGAIIAARHQSIPVILDGFVVCTAAAILHAIDPKAIAHCTAGHLSAEPAHGALLDRIGLTPLHNMGIAIGDGTGAAYALSSLQLSASGLSTLIET